METIDDVIQHFGVRGMKWGVRKSHGSPAGPASSKAKGHVSEDAASAKAFRTKAKTHGTHALSNKELQHLVNRMNLEQQYSRLSSTHGNRARIKKGHNFIKESISLGRTVSDVISISRNAHKLASIDFKGMKLG